MPYDQTREVWVNEACEPAVDNHHPYNTMRRKICQYFYKPIMAVTYINVIVLYITGANTLSSQPATRVPRPMRGTSSR